MKTFTEAERREIEQRIQNACAGTKFEGPLPEFFLRPPTQFHQPILWPKFAKMDHRSSKPQIYFTPSFKIVLVNEAGQMMPFGIEGQN